MGEKQECMGLPFKKGGEGGSSVKGKHTFTQQCVGKCLTNGYWGVGGL